MGLVLGGLGGVVLLGLVWWFSAGNRFIQMDEETKAAWAQVENVYQRRADLIPNLVATVKGYAKHEAQVLTEVTQARAQVGQVKVNSAADIQNFEKAQSQLTSALSRLMVVVEKYPELKADKNFSELQSQLEGTENRITVERMRYIESVRAFNTAIKMFPGSLVASSRGLSEKPAFQADAGAKTAPKVEF